MMMMITNDKDNNDTKLAIKCIAKLMYKTFGTKIRDINDAMLIYLMFMMRHDSEVHSNLNSFVVSISDKIRIKSHLSNISDIVTDSISIDNNAFSIIFKNVINHNVFRYLIRCMRVDKLESIYMQGCLASMTRISSILDISCVHPVSVMVMLCGLMKPCAALECLEPLTRCYLKMSYKDSGAMKWTIPLIIARLSCVCRAYDQSKNSTILFLEVLKNVIISKCRDINSNNNINSNHPDSNNNPLPDNNNNNVGGLDVLMYKKYINMATPDLMLTALEDFIDGGDSAMSSCANNSNSNNINTKIQGHFKADSNMRGKSGNRKGGLSATNSYEFMPDGSTSNNLTQQPNEKHGKINSFSSRSLYYDFSDIIVENSLRKEKQCHMPKFLESIIALMRDNHHEFKAIRKNKIKEFKKWTIDIQKYKHEMKICMNSIEFESSKEENNLYLKYINAYESVSSGKRKKYVNCNINNANNNNNNNNNSVSFSMDMDNSITDDNSNQFYMDSISEVSSPSIASICSYTNNTEDGMYYMSSSSSSCSYCSNTDGDYDSDNKLKYCWNEVPTNRVVSDPRWNFYNDKKIINRANNNISINTSHTSTVDVQRSQIITEDNCEDEEFLDFERELILMAQQESNNNNNNNTCGDFMDVDTNNDNININTSDNNNGYQKEEEEEKDSNKEDMYRKITQLNTQSPKPDMIRVVPSNCEYLNKIYVVMTGDDGDSYIENPNSNSQSSPQTKKKRSHILDAQQTLDLIQNNYDGYLKMSDKDKRDMLIAISISDLVRDFKINRINNFISSEQWGLTTTINFCLLGSLKCTKSTAEKVVNQLGWGNAMKDALISYRSDKSLNGFGDCHDMLVAVIDMIAMNVTGLQRSGLDKIACEFGFEEDVDAKRKIKFILMLYLAYDEQSDDICSFMNFAPKKMHKSEIKARLKQRQTLKSKHINEILSYVPISNV